MELVWNVYWYEPNSHKIVSRNVFNLSSKFQRELDTLKTHRHDWRKEYFSLELKKACQYCFWAKCEYEILIGPWVGGEENDFVKIDVYSQLMLNWDKFSHYVWENI